MHKLEEIRAMLMRELEECAKDDISMKSLEVIDKITHSIKSIDTIMAMEGYSNDDGSYASGRRYAKRDSMGRYSSRGSYDTYDSGRNSYYSRAEGKEHLMEELKSLMQDAKDPESRQMLDEWIRELRQ